MHGQTKIKLPSFSNFLPVLCSIVSGCKKPALGMKKVSVSTYFNSEQKLNTASHTDHWSTWSHYESRGEVFHMWGRTEILKRFNSINTQCAAEPQNPASRYQLGRPWATVGFCSRYVMFILTSVTELFKSAESASTYSNVGLYTGCFMTLGHNCRRWFPRSLWSKKFI